MKVSSINQSQILILFPALFLIFVGSVSLLNLKKFFSEYVLTVSHIIKFNSL